MKEEHYRESDHIINNILGWWAASAASCRVLYVPQPKKDFLKFFLMDEKNPKKNEIS